MTPEKLILSKAKLLDYHLCSTITPEVLQAQMIDYIALAAKESGDERLRKETEILIQRYKIAVYAERYFSHIPPSESKQEEFNSNLSLRLLKVV